MVKEREVLFHKQKKILLRVEEKCAKDETDTYEKKAKKAILSGAPALKGDIDDPQDGIGSDNHEDT